MRRRRRRYGKWWHMRVVYYTEIHSLLSDARINMTDYIDGFVLPIPKDCLDDYRCVAEAIAEIWKEHGALDYREFMGDDLVLEGTRSFTEAITAREGDVIVFGWVSFASREARDIANAKVAVDPRMPELMESVDTGFDAKRMAYAGFRPLI